MDANAFDFAIKLIGVVTIISTLCVIGSLWGIYALYRYFRFNQKYALFKKYNPDFGKLLNESEKKKAFEIYETRFDKNERFETTMVNQRRILDAIDEFGNRQH